MLCRLSRFVLVIFGLVSISLSFPSLSTAQARTNLGDIYRSRQGEVKKQVDNLVKPNTILSYSVPFESGTKINIVYPERWESLANNVRITLKDTYQEYSKAFGEIPAFSSSVRLMEEETFYISTGAPTWTNALYYKGQILIPISDKSQFDLDNIQRSLKHELMHAVVNALSKGHCPGWLDEGLASWAEGKENSALQPALARYLKRNPPVPLSLLQSGFTKLETKMVPAAYAQSLYATRSLINTYGLKEIGEYLRELSDGNSKSKVFIESFKMSENTFEEQFSKSLKEWAKPS
jgi:Peptidase MA superfamily